MFHEDTADINTVVLLLFSSLISISGCLSNILNIFLFHDLNANNNNGFHSSSFLFIILVLIASSNNVLNAHDGNSSFSFLSSFNISFSFHLSASNSINLFRVLELSI
ncbi:MAG: hypothetical protein WCG25_05640 [bacterium]